MKIILHQVFPLGRLHATPWKVNPFDDPYGEWPPSPWRLVRAVVARWYQWAREAEPPPSPEELDALVRALCTSTYSFHLPVHARRGYPLRQYHPVELEMSPPNFKAHTAEFPIPDGGVSSDLQDKLREANAAFEPRGSRLFVRVKKAKQKKEIERLVGTPVGSWRGLHADPGLRSYTTSLAQDNYWCMPCGEDGAVWWFLEGSDWTEELIQVLDRCLERVTYFGRAETFTRIRRGFEPTPGPNCILSEHRASDLVPVLAPSPEASRADVERITDDPQVAGRSVPPGARVLYAQRPPRPPSHEVPGASVVREDCWLMQFAVGWNVAPEPRAIVRLTERLRGAVISELARIKTRDPSATWSRAPADVREAMADVTGKDGKGRPLQGHRHAEFLAWCDGNTVTRLLIWRVPRPFDEDEQVAILRAASRELSWAAGGLDSDEWKVRLVPLDRDVPPPPGFGGVPARSWESVTPYVPPRHHLRRGRVRAGESLAAQIRRELALRGFAATDRVEVAIGEASWVAVHVPRGRAGRRSFVGDRRGYRVRLVFPHPVTGPIRLGHSSSFGLGLFRPNESGETGTNRQTARPR